MWGWINGLLVSSCTSGSFLPKDRDSEGSTDSGSTSSAVASPHNHDGDLYQSCADYTEVQEITNCQHQLTGIEDCNDDDALIYPGATEIPFDGIDQDCDGADWLPDCYIPEAYQRYAPVLETPRTIPAFVYYLVPTVDVELPTPTYSVQERIDRVNSYLSGMQLAFEVVSEDVVVLDDSAGYPEDPDVFFDTLAGYAVSDSLTLFVRYADVLPYEPKGSFYLGQQTHVVYQEILSTADILGNTITHDIGHALGLQHTYVWPTNVGELELVDESNCLTGGDVLCDTPADPAGLRSNAATGCVASLDCETTWCGEDANGQTYQPDVHNMMSDRDYLHCWDHFSQDQQRVMNCEVTHHYQ